VLFLIPIVHWFALHRLLSSLDARLKEAASRRGQPGTSGEANTVTIALADVTWVLSVLPWAIMLVVSLVRGGWPGGRVMPVCGTLIASVFVVADLAAMEGIQRRFVALVRKL
jgi:hypothetical protein